MLGEMIAKKNADKANEESARLAKNDSDRNKILENISGDLSKSLQPVLADLAKNSKLSTEDIRAALAEAIQISMPKVEMPTINVPEIKVPDIHIPAPIVNVPAPIVHVAPTPVTFPSEMALKRGGKPFAVIMMDEAGKPMRFPQMSGGVSGGRGDFFTLSYTTANPLPVVVTSGAGASTAANISDSSGVGYSGSNPFPVYIASGGAATSATNIVDSSGVAYSGSNPVPVTITAGASATTAVVGDSPSGATDPDQSQPVKVGGKYNVTPPTFTDGQRGDLQLSSRGSARVEITGAGSAQGIVNLVDNADGVAATVVNGALKVINRNTLYDSIADAWNRLVGGAGVTNVGTMRVVQAVDSVSSVVVNSGTITTVTGITNSVAAANIDSSGVQYSGSNPFPFTLVTSATASMNAALIDSGGVQYSGSNPVPVTGTVTVSSVTNSIAALNVDSSGVGYSGSNPFPVTTVGGGPDSMFVLIAHTATPTAVADGADVRAMADKLGRTITRPIHVRDLIATAYATISTGTEVTLLAAGGAGVFLDLISVILSNNSTASVQVDLRAVTGGNIVQTFQVPANATTGWTPPVPWPQDATNNNWTIDIPDITGTSVMASGLFSKEI